MMSMKGGGQFDLGPGQFSPSSEATVCTILGLVEANSNLCKEGDTQCSPWAFSKYLLKYATQDSYGDAMSNTLSHGVKKLTENPNPKFAM